MLKRAEYVTSDYITNQLEVACRHKNGGANFCMSRFLIACILRSFKQSEMEGVGSVLEIALNTGIYSQANAETIDSLKGPLMMSSSSYNDPNSPGPSTPSSRLRTVKISPLGGISTSLETPTASTSAALQNRRSSSRSIKRKKFDDELVESSLIKSSRGRLLTSSSSIQSIASGSWSSPSTPFSGEPPHIEFTPSLQTIDKKKTSKSASKRPKKPKAVIGKDVGRWKPADDLALIIAVQQTNDLTTVYKGVKFSCKFTLHEVQERWYALLYDPVISRMAVSAMKQLHPEIVLAIQSKALFSKAEEELMGTVTSTSLPTVDTFQALLHQHPDIFHAARTAKSLSNHWLLMKQYHLLPDQTVQPFPKGEHILNFSDAEDLLDDEELQDPTDEAIEHELQVTDRRIKREIRHLENELPKWQVMVDSVTGISPPDFDNQTLAVLKGRLVRYLMRSREITLGRSTKDTNIDMDLSLEGPAWKISKRQGVIKLRNTGEFYLANEGKRPVYIDAKPVLTGNKSKLGNNSVVEIAGLRFIFLVNQDLISVVQAEAAKTAT